MSVFLVGAGPGDPGLITVRGLELVRSCDVLVHDRLVARELVAEAPREALRIGRDRLRQDEIEALLVRHGRAGRRVVRLKGGDPFLFGRGGEEALALAAAGVPFEVVPGVSSLTAAPAAAGIPVTHRGLASELTIVAGHDAAASRGSPRRRPGWSRRHWSSSARSSACGSCCGRPYSPRDHPTGLGSPEELLP